MMSLRDKNLGRRGCCLPAIKFESSQTHQQIAEFVRQVTVRTDDEMRKKPFDPGCQVCIIAQEDADDRIPGAF